MLTFQGPFLNPYRWGGRSDHVTNIVILEITRAVLAIGVFAIGVESPEA